LAAGLALVALGATASLARADDSQIRISEVYFDGSVAHGDFIELQLLADGQSIPGTGNATGASIRLCNGNHSNCVFFDFPPNAPLPASNAQRTVLFGWDDNPNTDFGELAADAPPNLNSFPLAGGDACYFRSAAPSIPIDCMSWGNSTGLSPSVGSPAPALNAGQSLTRGEGRGCPTLMEAIDDSDNSVADFSLATPSPRNNLQTPTETPCVAPASAPPPTTTPVTRKKKCKKKKHKSSAVVAKKCKKHKK
jgi:hypothetical protein